jgi:hypothetical protein
MSEQTKRPETVEEMAAQHLARKIRAMADDLRRTAAQLDNIAVDAERPGGLPNPYQFAAGRVTSEISNMLPNLGLSGLISYAADADVARVRGE